jgi:hypothetical protein
MDAMMSELERSLEAKRERRLVLAKLPYTEKVKILIELQKISAPILRARGKRAFVFEQDR